MNKIVEKRTKTEFETKGEKGITLIALVVTIIVLLILSGISISMLAGNNGVLNKATEASTNVKKSSAKEQIQIAITGSVDANIGNNSINVDKLKTELTSIGATVNGTDFPLLVALNGQKYAIYDDGKIADMSDGKTTNVTKINADVAEMSTDEKMVYYQGIYGKTVDYQPVADIKTSKGTKNEYKNAKWKILYADERHIYLIADSYVTYESLPKGLNEDESVKYTFTQSYSDTENTNYNIFKAHFNNSSLLSYYAGGTNKINTYSKASVLKLLNKDFFYKVNSVSGELEDNLKGENRTNGNYNGTSYNNMKAVASMLDTDLWDTKYKDNSGYAEYTIGGPTLEMILDSYNQTHGTHRGALAYKAGEKHIETDPETGTETETPIASYDGYKICTDTTTELAADRTSSDWKYSAAMFTTGSQTYNTLYVSETGTTNANAFWLASPSASYTNYVIYVYYNGYVSYDSYNGATLAFRPLVCLKSNVQLVEASAEKQEQGIDFELK